MTRIGIVGGVGPHAAAYFYQRLLDLCPAVLDEDYPAVVLVAERIPSRIDHQLGRGPSPVSALREAICRLVAADADVIAIPSATTHAYLPVLVNDTSVPIMDLLAETGGQLRRAELTRPLILATEATAALRSYEPALAPGVAAGYPNTAAQATVTEFIHRVKRGEPVTSTRAEFTAFLRELLVEHPRIDCVVLGCTELSVIAPSVDVGRAVVDVTDVLIRAVLAHRTQPRHGAPNELEVPL